MRYPSRPPPQADVYCNVRVSLRRSVPYRTASVRRIARPGVVDAPAEVVAMSMAGRFHYGLDEEMRPGVFQPHEQFRISNLSVVMRTSVDPLSLSNSVRQLVRARDPELPVDGVTTMSAELSESLWARRGASWLAAMNA